MDLQAQLLAKTAPSFGQMFRDRVAKTPNRLAFMAPDRADGPNTWEEITWAQSKKIVDELAAGLLAIGLQYEQRVAIASSTRIEWVFLDLAIGCAAGATTTVYPNTQAEDVEYIVSHSDSVVYVAEDPSQIEKIQGRGNLDTQIHTIILLEGNSSDPRVISYNDFRTKGRAYLKENPDCVDLALTKTNHDSLSTLIYTSGTTGQPKGVELTHLSWVYMGVATKYMKIIDEDNLQYLWLPMSHVFGKCLISTQLEIGYASAIDGRIDRIVTGLGEVKPTLMCGAPRIFEKVRNAVMTGNTGFKADIARWAFSVGRASRPYRLANKPLPLPLAVKYKIADKLVFSKLKKKMGGRMKLFISGSAKLSKRVQEWFYSAGLLIIEGYGMTESSAIAFVDDPANPHLGTVGRVTAGIETRIAEDGEILIRGPIVMRGYHKDPQRTAEALSDGWLHTGDIGEISADGYLTITDRKKDLMKTSGGKYVTPAKVESAITANIPYVSQAVAVADGRKYVSVLLTMDKDLLIKWGEKRGFGSDYAELTQHPELHATLERQMEKVNAQLERWETVKKFAILPSEFSVEEGGVTSNMKVKRAWVTKRYAQIVDSLYEVEDIIE